MTPKELKYAYGRYKAHAGHCVEKTDKLGKPVEMRMSFEQWLDVWIKSGKWHLRGKRRGEYCMSRVGDIGHYEVGNVFIQLATQNTRDSCTGAIQTPKAKQKQIAAQRGKTNNANKPCTIDGGITVFNSHREMGRALGYGKNGTRHPNFTFLVPGKGKPRRG